MPLLVDPAAKTMALRRWALPECLHVPTAAIDEAAIETYIGRVVRVLARREPNRALLVEVPEAPPRDLRLPIWQFESSSIFHDPLQVRVHIAYGGYRRAYKRAFPAEDIQGKILSHTMNRRTAALKGLQYVRLTPASRAANSSSAFSENWAVALHATRESKKSDAFIQYADLTDLMLMLDLRLGGGVMDIVNEGQRLVRPASVD